MFGETPREGSRFYLMMAYLAPGFPRGHNLPHTRPYLGYVYEGRGAEASVLTVSAALLLTAFLSVIMVRERDG